MSDKEKAEKQDASTHQGASGSPILLAFIQYGSRPVAVVLVAILLLIWLSSVREPIIRLLDQTEELTFGDFVVKL